MVTISVLVLLGVCSITDVWKKKIWMPFLGGAFPILCIGLWRSQEDFSLNVACALFTGIFFAVFSVATEGQIGMGDSVLLAMVVLSLGFWKGVLFLGVSFFVAFLVAVFLLMVKKKKRNYRIAFVPCMLCGYVVCCYIL